MTLLGVSSALPTLHVWGAVRSKASPLAEPRAPPSDFTLHELYRPRSAGSLDGLVSQGCLGMPVAARWSWSA